MIIKVHPRIVGVDKASSFVYQAFQLNSINDWSFSGFPPAGTFARCSIVTTGSRLPFDTGRVICLMHGLVTTSTKLIYMGRNMWEQKHFAVGLDSNGHWFGRFKMNNSDRPATL